MIAAHRHGLVVGKFYPPHQGHLHLITTAAGQCASVTVLVMAAREETVPLADRVRWLQADLGSQPGVTVTGVRCDVPVDFDDPVIWAAQLAVMLAALRRDGRPPVDAVFSSEPYGAELAARLHAAHVAVDPPRAAVPISASQIRGDLAGCWDWLTPAARAGLATRVVALGAESTGTSTIAGLLAEHFRRRGGVWARTRCVSEAGRDYTALKWEQARATAAAAGLPEPPLDRIRWAPADFDAVAAEQTRLEDAAAAAGSPLVVCDTDAFATSVWERRYLAGAARGRQPWATSLLPRHDLYLLTSHEGVPWHDDGLREGDLTVRAAMTGWFADALTEAGHAWVLLSGNRAERAALAIGVTTALLSSRLRFGPAITVRSPAAASPVSGRSGPGSARDAGPCVPRCRPAVPGSPTGPGSPSR
jgi:HTH-type transcriptional regulator, transcriptional repressor of NAD biosynthesis genes